MGKKYWKTTLFLFTLIFIMGCLLKSDTFKVKSNEKQTQESEKDQKQKKEDFFKIGLGESPYYYFLLSQIKLNENNLKQAILLLDMAVKYDPQSSFLKKELAVLYMYNNDITASIKKLEEIFKIDENYVEGLILYGNIQKSMKNYEKAIAIYEKVLKIDPTKKRIAMILGNVYYEKKEYDSAIKTYKKGLKIDPEFYGAYFFMGKIYAEQGKFEQAEKALLKTIQLSPELIEPHIELISLYAKENNKKGVKTTQSNAYYEKQIVLICNDLLKVYPENINALIELGISYRKTGDHKKAQKYFDRVIEKSTNDAVDLVKIVVKSLMNKKRNNDAIVILEQILKKSSNKSKVHYTMALAYTEKGKVKKAIEHYKKVGTNSKFYEFSRLNIVFLLKGEKKYKEAVSIMEKLLKKAPENIEYLMYLSLFQQELKQFKKAEKTIQKALKAVPGNTKVLFALGVLHDKWGNREKSLEHMRKILLVEPENPSVLNYIGYTYVDMGIKLDEAEKLIIKALKYKPDDPYITDSLGWLYYKKGMYKKAEIYLKKAVKQVPSDPILLEHLGDLFFAVKNYKQAFKNYNKALKYSTEDNKGLKEKIRTVKK